MTPPADEHLPPNDTRAEAALLGACLLDPRALDDAVEHLAPADFYDPRHAELFAAAVAMRDHGQRVDAITLANHIGDTRLGRLGGRPYLHDLISGVPTAANAAYYAEIVHDTATRRRLAEAGQRAIQLAHHAEGDPDDLVERARKTLDAVAAAARGDLAPVDLAQLIDAAMVRYDTGTVPALSVGLPDLDRVMGGGLRPGTLTVLAARPALGKSLVAGCVATYVAQAGTGCLFISLEMTKEELTDRIIANLSSVAYDRIRRHALTDDDWGAVASANERFRDIPLAIEDHPTIGVTGIRSLARDRTRTARGLGLLIVDYLALIRPADPKAPRQEQVATISRDLKLVAKELDVPVLALHQLNRQPEMRASRRPQLSDLRESGALEQDADAVWLLHRDPDGDGDPFEIEVIVAKNRGGPVGNVTLFWAPEVARVACLSRTLRAA